MNKKGLLGGLAALSILAVAAVGFASVNRSNVNMPAAHADSTVYKLNRVDWKKEVNSDVTGGAYNGVDGLHFNITSPDGTDWHIKMWNNEETPLSLVNGTSYKMHVDFDVVSLTGENKLDFITNGTNATGILSNAQYSQGYNLTHEVTFTATSTNPQLEIQFGKTVGAFEVIVKRVVISESESGTEVRRSYLEDYGEFAKKWKSANHELDLCHASDETVKTLLRNYADLLPWHREQFDAIEDVNHYDRESATTLGAEVAYFALRHNVRFE